MVTSGHRTTGAVSTPGPLQHPKTAHRGSQKTRKNRESFKSLLNFFRLLTPRKAVGVVLGAQVGFPALTNW